MFTTPHNILKDEEVIFLKVDFNDRGKTTNIKKFMEALKKWILKNTN